MVKLVAVTQRVEQVLRSPAASSTCQSVPEQDISGSLPCESVGKRVNEMQIYHQSISAASYLISTQDRICKSL